MHLISCYIAGFGKFRDQSFSFDETLTQFIGENGWGKTTLSDFLFAMFYGMPTDNKRAVEFPLRKRYCPFDGGNFGGTLTCSVGGDLYRIERTFDAKSQTKDTCTIYKNNKELPPSKEELGTQFFHVKADSFRRLISVGSDALAVSRDEDVMTGLRNTAMDAPDTGGYDTTRELLEKEKKLLSGRGDTGLIPKTKQQIKELESQIRNLETCVRELSDLYRQRAELQEDIRTREAAEKERIGAESLLEKWKAWDRAQESLRTVVQAKASWEANHPYGIPPAEIRQEIRLFYQDRPRLVRLMEDGTISREERGRYETLSHTFRDGVPDRDTLTGWESAVTRLSLAYREKEKAEITPPSADDDLTRRFEGKYPSEETKEAVRTLAKEYAAIKEQIKTEEDVWERTKQLPPTKKGSLALALGLGIGLGLLGVVLAFFLLPLGIALLVVGIVGSILCRPRTQAVPVDPTGEATLIRLKGQLKQKQEALRTLLVPYSYYTAEILADVTAFEKDLDAYEKQSERLRTHLATLSELTQSIHTTEIMLRDALSPYLSPVPPLEEGVRTLIRMAEDYHALKTKFDASQTEKERAKQAWENGMARMCDLLAPYHITPPEEYEEAIFTNWIQDETIYQSILSNIQNREEEVAACQTELGDSERPAISEVSLEEAHDNLSALREDLVRLDHEIDACERDAELLGERTSRLKELESTLAEAKQRLRILDGTLSCLKTAEESLEAKYVAPVQDKLTEYAERVAGTRGKKLTINGSYELRYEVGGVSREEAHLSQGQRTAIALCMRLAFLDNIFKEEKPFILLDDPFSALDTDAMQAVASLLETLSQTMQIVYFCCHPSRKIKG